jgi:glycosyltransferase involved in cell wall biosynthesis
MRTPQVLLDMTQFVSHPRATGIQRVLLAMVEGLRPDGVEVLPAARMHGGYVLAPAAVAAELLHAQFERRASGSADDVDVAGTWVDRATRRLDPDQVPRAVDGFLLAELTTNPATLADVSAFAAGGLPTAAVYYDSLPLLHPEWFSGWDQVSADRYYRTVAELDDLAFISDAVRREFEARVVRRPVTNSVVAFPGVDQTVPDHRPAPSPARFVCVGAVEPRKRTDVVVEAVARLRAEGHDVTLTVVGGVSTADRPFVDRLRHHAHAGVFTWLEDASDAEVSDLVASSSGMVYAGQLEGYGLPPLEALRTGVPCLTSASLPSLEAVGADGLVVVDTFEVDAVAAAMADLADPSRQEVLREQARSATTPTWQEFNARVAELLLEALRRSREPAAAEGA